MFLTTRDELAIAARQLSFFVDTAHPLFTTNRRIAGLGGLTIFPPPQENISSATEEGFVEGSLF